MAKTVKKERIATTEITAKYEKDSKRYRRFLVEENEAGIVGTIYLPKGKDLPETINITFVEE